jgi:methylenetetrahydrofolate dehydrogenase (NADP+)/methenyltetrahydrofolate cyclohydrolase
MARRITGDDLADRIRADLRDDIEELAAERGPPRLSVVHVGNDPDTRRYVEHKRRDCEDVGIGFDLVDPDPETTRDELAGIIAGLNEDDGVHGILVQSDVPDHIDWQDAIERIDPLKDVDGLHPENVGRLVAGDPRFEPCTPAGIRRLLVDAGVSITGADVVIVNRSAIVGKPLANLLLADREDGNATVTVCHSHTTDLAEKTRRADILVVAVGKPEFVDGSMVSAGTTVVDVGITSVERDGESTVVGDVEYDTVEPKCDALVPVPGGVGPLTRAMLLYNTVEAAKRQTEGR